jgi:6-phosphogluconolactonase
VSAQKFLRLTLLSIKTSGTFGGGKMTLRPVAKRLAWLVLTGFLALAWMSGPQAPTALAKSLPAASSYFVYVGTYTGPKSKGIYAYRYDPKSGQYTPMGVAAEVANPSWVVTDPSHRFLYAVTEAGNDGKTHGTISSYSIDAKNGALTFLNKVDSGGGGACHLVVDRTGKMLFVANYGSGSVASFALHADGSIGDQTGFDQHSGSSVNPQRQKGPHAHEVVLSPDNRFLFVPDLGTDQIKIYRVDAAKATFAPNDPGSVSVKAGLGPRHFTFGRGGKFAYLVCEMGSSVVAFSYDAAKGSLTPIQTISNLPTGFTGEDNSAEITVDASGRFLYASNRGNDSITVYAIDPHQGTLTKVQVAPTKGNIPRNFALDPTGKYLLAANQKSDQLVVFSIDPKDGQLKPTGQTIDVPAPVSILFVPAQ